MVALEHNLIMLLLLISLLSANPKLPHFMRWFLVLGVMLAFVAPITPLALPWNWLSALLFPLLIWQIAHRLVESFWKFSLRDLLIWFFLVLSITTVISLTANLTLAIAFLFALLISSVVWQAAQEPGTANLLGMLGPLTLAFLITEIDPAVINPSQYAVSLVGGLGLGALVGYLAVNVAVQIPVGLGRNFLTLGQVYLAYLAGMLLGVSSIVAAVVSVMLYVAYGIKRGLWLEGRIHPQPLNSPFVLVFAAAALAFFSWQTHVPLSLNLMLELGLILLIVFAGILVGRKVGSPTFSSHLSPLLILTRVVMLIIPAVLLWQPTVALEPGPLTIALLIAGVTALGAHFGLTPLLNLYRWLDEIGQAANETGENQNFVRVSDLMRREWLAVNPQMPAAQLARLFVEREVKVGLITGDDGRLVGLVTEADLFVKETRLPRTDRIYPILFNTPVTVNRLVDDYSKLAEHCPVEDIMNTKVISIMENQSLARAVQEMTQYDLDCLPVVSAIGTPVGILTRSDIINSLLDGKLVGEARQISSRLE
jgi:CBS domain-containing protein